MEVTVGKPFSISISIDDNLAGLLEVSAASNTLSIKLKGNRNNKLYIENTHIVIQISMPKISILNHNGNSNLIVNDISGQYFKLKNNDNGNVQINGVIDELEISNHGNGNVHAEGLAAKKITIHKSGNGYIMIDTDDTFSANGSGNGDVVNKGKGRADEGSHISGNGQVI